MTASVKMKLLTFIAVYIHCHVIYVHGSLSDITEKVFPAENGDIVAAFGDFNADKLTDIFVISDKGRRVDLLLAQDDALSFKRQTLINRTKSQDDVITSVMPGDFDGDVQMDVLITILPGADKKSDSLKAEVYWGKSGKTVDHHPYTVSEPMTDQPLLFDWNADMLPDLLCRDVVGGPTVWQAIRPNADIERGFTKITLEVNFQLAKDQAHSFVDLNGDNTPDLVMVTENNTHIEYDVWINDQGKLKHSHVIPWPAWFDTGKSKKKQPYAHTGQASFFDLDMDSKVELILPVCCNDNCQESRVLVYGDVMVSDGDYWHTMVDGFKGGQADWGFVPPEQVTGQSRIKQTFPITLRVGDFDMNGFPDAIVTLREVNRDKKKSNDDAPQKAFILKNEECNTGECKDVGRTFNMHLDSTLLEHEGVVLATLMDIYEDGILDVIITLAGDEKNGTRLLAFRNDLQADACFLKIIVVSGICGSSCSSGQKSYGVNQPGPTIRYKTTNTNGKSQRSCDSQLTQSSYFSLQLPYVIFGLGQTPNFVETVTVGIQRPANVSSRQETWTQLIPNSQLIVIPHPNDEPSKWTLKLFVQASQLVYITGAVLVGTCGFIAGIVGILHWREKREDKKEKMQDAQKFHFDAM